MSISLHTATIGTFLQILPSVSRLIGKAETYCAENGLPPGDIAGACLADGMWNFAKQVDQTLHHSVRAIEGVRAGLFGPDSSPAPLDFPALRQMVQDGMAFLETVEPAELDALAERDMRFEFGKYSMDFTVGNFLLSFSLPNFYFHATTVYDILRSRGLKIGKTDFLGKPRIRT